MTKREGPIGQVEAMPLASKSIQEFGAPGPPNGRCVRVCHVLLIHTLLPFGVFVFEHLHTSYNITHMEQVEHTLIKQALRCAMCPSNIAQTLHTD
jgi:hypothetical protein